MLRSISIAIALLTLSATAKAATCDDVPEAHRRDTVIVFAPPTTFTICRRGKPQDDLVAGRRVYLMLAPRAGESLFDFRIHGRSAEPGPSGLAELRDQAGRVASALLALVDSSATIDELEQPANAAALKPVAAARMLYLGVATPRFHEALEGIGEEVEAIAKIARIVTRWCGDLPARESATSAMEHLRARCQDETTRESAVERAVQHFLTVKHQFRERRAQAREALIESEVDPGNAATQAAAVKALDAARAAAHEVVESAQALLPIARRLGGDAVLLRHAVSSAGALHPGHVVYLGTYGRAGSAVLELDVHPIAISAAGVDTGKDTSTITHRFAVVDTHYVDVEFGLGITGGVPDVINLATQNGKTVLQGRPLDEFAALFTFALEPARFFAVDKPWAGLLRLPVLGIPVSENPTTNFFIGAGLGWTGIGSICAGPYLVRETTLKPGYAIGQPLPVGSSLPAVTQTTLQTGYFVSLSVDLLGLYHLVVPRRMRTFDAAGGAELQ